eukprot:5022784-Pleurochrysis_carterae.AAC.1
MTFQWYVLKFLKKFATSVRDAAERDAGVGLSGCARALYVSTTRCDGACAAEPGRQPGLQYSK